MIYPSITQNYQENINKKLLQSKGFIVQNTNFFKGFINCGIAASSDFLEYVVVLDGGQSHSIFTRR